VPFSVRHSNSSNKTSPGHREQLKSTVPRKRLPAALSKLSPRELAALLLYKFEGLSSLDIGQVLGLNAKAVASVLLQVYTQLWHLTNTQPSYLNVATLPCKRDNR
jgi:DNA-directed RNA polymerase specialized sigma24 family protein